VLELTDLPPYVCGYQIWEHEIEWREHKITRRGYLFFGAPNERSTAQPQWDFYLYFLQPFEPPQFEDEKLADEVFFKLTHMDKQFQDTPRLYAGAREMAASASAGTKKVYEYIADGFLKPLVTWLRTNILTSFDVIHQGVSKKMVEWLIRTEKIHEETVKQLRAKASELTEKVVTVAQYVQTGLPCWGSELIPSEEREQQPQKLDGLKDFLEGLQAFNTPGKLENFSKTVMEI